MITGIALLVVSLACIAVITLTPARDHARLPFWCFKCGTRPGVDVVLNILMLAPIGIGLGLLRLRARWVVLAIVCTTLAIELLQYAVVPGRFASARDIVANTVGGICAWRMVLASHSLVSPPPARAVALSIAAASMWIMTQLFTAWALTLVAPPAPWWAQIRLRDLGFSAVFEGTVVRSSIGTTPIRYSDQLEDTEPVRRQFIDGAPMTVLVTGVEPTKGAAPILLLAAVDRLSEITALGQTGRDAFFRVRTRAAVIGLRNPALRLDDVFPAGSSADTIRLTGQFIDGRYSMTSEHAGHPRSRTLAASSNWTWALLVPIPHYSFGAEVRILTAAWVFMALALAGLWAGQGAARFTGRSPTGAYALAVAPMIVAIGFGLALIPIAFGLPVSHWSEWIASTAGLVAGFSLGRRMQWRRAAGRPIGSPRG